MSYTSEFETVTFKTKIVSILFVLIILSIFPVLIALDKSQYGINYQRFQDCLEPIENSLKVESINFIKRESELEKGIQCLESHPYNEKENINYTNILSIGKQLIVRGNYQEVSSILVKNIDLVSEKSNYRYRIVTYIWSIVSISSFVFYALFLLDEY